MKNRTLSTISLLLLAVLFVSLVFVNNQMLSPLRIDLTENKIYSLADGSKQIVAAIDEPISLRFFFSDKASKDMTGLRNYASRVESILNEYQTLSKGKIILQVLDPEPFSEYEDLANEYGLTSANFNPNGDAIYMGLVATNALDQQKVIAFFDPQKERFLEYEISELLYQLSEPEEVSVAIITDLPIQGGPNPMTGQTSPPWAFLTQLQQLYSVETLGTDIQYLPKDIDVLALIHPQQLSDSLLYQIDQFVLAGGKLIAFIDPHYESDQMALLAGAQGQINGSDLEPLLKSWGVEFDSQQVVLDALSGLDIRTQDGRITRHFGFLGITQDQLNEQDVLTANLELINGASFGALSQAESASTAFEPLLQSSINQDLKAVSDYAKSIEPDDLSKGFVSKNQAVTLAARVTGNANSAFSEGRPASLTPNGETIAEAHIETADNINLVLVADVDLLVNRFWIQESNFFGQVIASPFANNGDFVNNAIENLSGSQALISIRSRGTFNRTFNKVDELKLIAEQRFREQEQVLQQQLDETEQQLTQLQDFQGDSQSLIISPEQQQAIDAFIDKRLEIRKSLREVRHQLDKDIEHLGNQLKVANIVVAPLVLVVVLVLLRLLFRTRAKVQGQQTIQENKAND
jgi:ABC-type uncharacterized transport system involved in gliding motility auxiliary subunit